MKRLAILNICLLFTMVSSFAQTVLETYDVNDDKQTTIIMRDSVESDEDILNQLDLDDYTVGEEVYISAEMWAEIQKEQKKVPALAVVDDKMMNPTIQTVVPQQTIVQEKSVVQAAAKPAKTTNARSSSSTKKVKKKKAKKKKRVKMKKSKRRKGGSGSRGGRMTCYRF